MTTIGAAIGAEETSPTITTFTFPIPTPYRRAIEAVTTDQDMPAEFVHHTRVEFVHHMRPFVTLHPMRAAIVPSTTQAPAPTTRLTRARLPIRGTSKNQLFQSPANFLDCKTAIRKANRPAQFGASGLNNPSSGER